MHWLSKQPAWSRSREFEITTRSTTKAGMSSSTNTAEVVDSEGEEDLDDEADLVHGRRKKKVAFLPSIDTTHSIFYRNHWLKITRTKCNSSYGNCFELRISVIARNNTVLKKLVMQAKKEYEADMEHRVHIFLADSYGSWRWNGARQKRPLSSIVLEPGVKVPYHFLHSNNIVY
jgi:mitochondrial chaperone BCS1